MGSRVRSLVSKKKRRFQEDGFDLDLSYITEQIIAMGFPSEGKEAMYRNPMNEVQNFFETRHKEHYKIYNLCNERGYDPSKFHDSVGCYPFSDHNCPPITMIEDFCKDCGEFLKDSKNVAAIHCKAGKGRTGVMICAYLVWSKMWPNAEEAMSYYGFVRTENQEGLTIPSQRRYIHYFEKYLKDGGPTTTPRELMAIQIHTCPKLGDLEVDMKTFQDTTRGTRIYHSNKKEKYPPANVVKDKKKGLTMLMPTPVTMSGDIKLTFNEINKSKDVFHLWFNTALSVEGDKIVLTKKEIDNAHKDKHNKVFDKNFSIELVFAPLDESIKIPEEQMNTVIGGATRVADCYPKTDKNLELEKDAPATPTSSGTTRGRLSSAFLGKGKIADSGSQASNDRDEEEMDELDVIEEEEEEEAEEKAEAAIDDLASATKALEVEKGHLNVVG